MKVALLDDYQEVARSAADWEGGLPGVEVVAFRSHLDEASLIERLADFEVVVAMRERTPFPERVLAALPRLRLLVTTGPRNAVIDVAAARAAGIVVSGTGGTAWATAELTWGLILALVRHIPTEDRELRAGRWQHTVGTDLHGATLGIVGLGHLGRQVAAIGQAFGMEVVAWSPHLDAARAAAAGVQAVDKATLFTRADVASVHMVLAESTRGLVGSPELRALGPRGYLVNTSRGPIVDQGALLDALHGGWVAGAGLDVFDEEPLPDGHPLLAAPRCVLTPHIGYVTEETYRIFYRDALEDVQAWLTGHPIRELS